MLYELSKHLNYIVNKKVPKTHLTLEFRHTYLTGVLNAMNDRPRMEENFQVPKKHKN